MNKEYITIKEFAERKGVSTQAIYQRLDVDLLAALFFILFSMNGGLDMIRTYQQRKDYMRKYYREYMKKYRKVNPDKVATWKRNFYIRQGERIMKERGKLNETV